MKTLSGTFRFIVLGVIVIAAVVSCCNYAFVVPGTIVRGTESFAFVDIGGAQKASTYVEWKGDGTKFKQALKQVRDHHGKICLCVVMPGGTPYPHQLNNDCPNYHCPPVNIRTVKVTKSEAADNIAAGGSAANDPHITYRVQSPDPGDIKKVLDALKP
jgi:hypothetical protein